MLNKNSVVVKVSPNIDRLMKSIGNILTTNNGSAIEMGMYFNDIIQHIRVNVPSAERSISKPAVDAVKFSKGLSEIKKNIPSAMNPMIVPQKVMTSMLSDTGFLLAFITMLPATSISI